MYPCRNNTEMNFAAFVPNEEANASGAGKSDLSGAMEHQNRC